MLYAIYQRDFGACTIVTRATESHATSKMIHHELKRALLQRARA
jgi:hypothetical protein